jgi:arylsulfatase A-like enzyme
MPRAKGTCYDPGLKTAFLAHWPGHCAGGKRYSEMISNLDFLPTVLDLAGVDTPKQVEGRSFLPLLADATYEKHTHLFSEMTWHDQYNPMRAVRTERYKYIRNFGDRPLVYLPVDIWETPAGRAMRDDYYGTRRPAEELYDLQQDPLEQTNLIADPAHMEVSADLRGRVADYMHDSNDILLYGDVPCTKAQLDLMQQEHWDNG